MSQTQDPEVVHEAFAQLAGELFREHQREWQSELDLLKAERRAILAELRADVLEAVAEVRAGRSRVK